MKQKSILVILLGILISFNVQAQSKVTVKLALIDSLSAAPVEFATVSLTPAGDSTAKYYSLTSSEGIATIDKVVSGKYTLKAELLGYVPFVKDVELDKSTANLGTFKMKEDVLTLEGATVSAVANPIVVKQDTVEYNASSFKVSENSMLIELLKKLPGIEVDTDGTVKAHGETIKKITVNGKTFFLDDPAIATENLPAKMVEKIKVIDQKSEQALFSGIQDGETEKVIDISTYKGMYNGWFGNIMAGGGMDLKPLEEGVSFFDENSPRYRANAMVGRFNDNDQIAFIGNANNVNEGSFGRGQRGGQMMNAGGGGIKNTWTIGGNYNTSRIEGVDFSASVGYQGTSALTERETDRTTFRNQGSDLYYNSDSRSRATSQSVTVGAEVRSPRNSDKPNNFYFMPQFAMNFTSRDDSSTDGTSDDSGKLNESESFSLSAGDGLSASGRFMYGHRIVKPGRTISVSGNYSISDNNTDGKDYSNTKYFQNDSTRLIDQYYHTDALSVSLTGNLKYTEPLGKDFYAAAEYQVNYRQSTSNKNTFDYNGPDHKYIANFDDADMYNIPNEYYSSEVRNNFVSHSAGLSLQYQKQRNFVQIGANFKPTYTETYTKNYGQESHIPGEWQMNWAPELRARYNFNESNSINAFYSGNSSQPSTSRMQTILNVANPTNISTGNSYLRSSFAHSGRLSFQSNNKNTYSYFNIGLNGNYTVGGTVTASWFDENGVKYSVPVNSKKPTTTFGGNLMYNTPIAKSNFSVSTNTSGTLSHSTSYQNINARAGIDQLAFDYDSFMAEFWGNADGDRFYRGESGFGESSTKNYSVSETLTFRYNGNKLSSSLRGSARYNNAKYSLNSKADKSTWNNTVAATVMYRPIGTLEFNTEASYNFYKGYEVGFGDPEFVWNFSVSKTVRKFTFTLSANDILSQSKNISRVMDENYSEDVRVNQLGRYVIFSISYRFGKMDNMRGGRGAGMNMRGGGFGGGMGGGYMLH